MCVSLFFIWLTLSLELFFYQSLSEVNGDKFPKKSNKVEQNFERSEKKNVVATSITNVKSLVLIRFIHVVLFEVISSLVFNVILRKMRRKKYLINVSRFIDG